MFQAAHQQYSDPQYNQQGAYGQQQHYQQPNTGAAGGVMGGQQQPQQSYPYQQAQTAGGVAQVAQAYNTTTAAHTTSVGGGAYQQHQGVGQQSQSAALAQHYPQQYPQGNNNNNTANEQSYPATSVANPQQQYGSAVNQQMNNQNYAANTAAGGSYNNSQYAGQANTNPYGGATAASQATAGGGYPPQQQNYAASPTNSSMPQYQHPNTNMYQNNNNGGVYQQPGSPLPHPSAFTSGTGGSSPNGASATFNNSSVLSPLQEGGYKNPKPQTPWSNNASFSNLSGPNGPQSGGQGGGAAPSSSGAASASRTAQRARPVVTTTRRIDPSQVPTPSRDLQQENATNRIRYNTSKGVPPYGVTNFIAIDDGNANPKFMRPTLTAQTDDVKLLNDTALQMSLVVTPLSHCNREETIPVVSGRPPVRCKRCRAYLSPNAATFISAGRKWNCHLCDMENDVDEAFFANLDHTGRRRDYAEKPELSRGSVEYDVTPYEEYASKDKTGKLVSPKPLSHLFVIDVSCQLNGAPNIILPDLIISIKASIERMATLYPMCRVSFVTYASTVHFYNFSNRNFPQLIVADTANPFVPLPFTLQCWLELGRDLDRIYRFLDSLLQIAADVNENECALGAAVKVASLILDDGGGKVILSGSKLPTSGLGVIKPREVHKFHGTPKEAELFKPIDGFYPTMAVECAKQQISFDLILSPTEFIELTTIGQLAHITGGAQNLFFNYDHKYDSHRLAAALDASLVQEAGYAGIMRARCSKGLAVKGYHGHYWEQDPLDMDLASVQGSSTMVVDIRQEAKIDPKSYAYYQVALLYTTRSGSRRVRVHTLKVPVCNSYVSLFRSVDLEACTFMYIKDAVHDALNKGTAAARTNITERLQKMLICYRKQCSTGSHSGQLLMPELLKLLPLYALALMKSDALVAGTTTPFDARVQGLFQLLTMPSARVLPYLYPRFYAVHNLYSHEKAGLIDPTSGSVLMPPIMQLTADTVLNYGVYLLQDQQAHLCYLWIGSQVSAKSSLGLFGVEDAKQVGVTVQFENFTERFQNIINYVVNQPWGRDRLIIIHEKKDLAIEDSFFRSMVEDENVAGSQSYSDLLCALHKKINSSLN